MATPLIGALTYVNYITETTFGVTPSGTASNMKPFGANVKIGNMSIDNQLTQKGGLGNAMPQANVAGANTNSFSLEFDVEAAKSSLNWMACMFGPCAVAAGSSAAPWVWPTDATPTANSLVTAPNAPASLSILIGTAVDAATKPYWLFTFSGCYATSARFEAATNETIHVSVDFVAKSVVLTETGATGATVAFVMSSQSIFNFAQAVVSGAGMPSCVVERFTVNIGREVTNKHGIGSRLPQALVPGLLSFGMDATVMYETGKATMQFAMGTASSATAHTIVNGSALTDTALVLTVTDGTKVLTFTSAIMYISKANLTADINDAIMMDISAQGLKTGVKLSIT